MKRGQNGGAPLVLGPVFLFVIIRQLQKLCGGISHGSVDSYSYSEDALEEFRATGFEDVSETACDALCVGNRQATLRE